MGTQAIAKTSINEQLMIAINSDHFKAFSGLTIPEGATSEKVFDVVRALTSEVAESILSALRSNDPKYLQDSMTLIVGVLEEGIKLAGKDGDFKVPYQYEVTEFGSAISPK